MFKTIVVFVVLLAATSVSAQVLTTAETIGQGKQVVAISENHLYDVDDVDLNVVYVAYIKGLTSRFDLYAQVGETHIFGQDQAFIGVGENVKLFSAKSISASVYSMTSFPLHRFEDASIVLVNAAVVVSRPITSKLSIFTGVNVFVPVGQISRGLFTPVENKLNIPLGASLTFGDWGVAGEADFGRMRAIGIAVSKMF